MPVPLVEIPKLPLVPLPEPAAGPEHDTEAEVAPPVDQLKVEPYPDVTVDGENEAVATQGAATTEIGAEYADEFPAAL